MSKKTARPAASSPRRRTRTPSRPRRTTITARRRHQGALASVTDSSEPCGACTVVYVHGIGNKPIESILKCQWDHALFGYDLGERSRLVYWVNREYYPAPSAGTCASGDLTEVENAPTGRALSVEQHLEQTRLKDEVSALTANPREQAILLRIAATIDGHIVTGSVSGTRAAGVHGFILPLPAPLRRWITRKLTRAFARDVNDYLFVKERREIMRQSLVDRLQAGGGPFIVVAHSQGTMIAYDVLCGMKNVDVPLFVTIGSPLGIQEVQDQLKQFTRQKKLAVPPSVGRWLNVYDANDPVAADETLADDYMPKNAIEDIEILNPDSPAHPHSGTGYLRTDVVRHAVREACRVDLFQPVAPFVIARNLVRRLENAPREAQHPVLIELVGKDIAAAPLDTLARDLAASIRKLTGRSDEELRLQTMRRYLAADLTRRETETLASQVRDAGPSGEANLAQRGEASAARILYQLDSRRSCPRRVPCGTGVTLRGRCWIRA